MILKVLYRILQYQMVELNNIKLKRFELSGSKIVLYFDEVRITIIHCEEGLCY